jgi:hypothetical protein
MPKMQIKPKLEKNKTSPQINCAGSVILAQNQKPTKILPIIKINRLTAEKKDNYQAFKNLAIVKLT